MNYSRWTMAIGFAGLLLTTTQASAQFQIPKLPGIGTTASGASNCATSTDPEVIRSCAAQQQEIQNRQQEQDNFIPVSAWWGKNGIFGKYTDFIGEKFPTREECGNYVDTVVRKAVAGGANGNVVADSVIVPTDGSGYVWFGCIKRSEYASRQFQNYVQVTMTKGHAAKMARFPDLSQYQNPQQEPSQRGSHVKI